MGVLASPSPDSFLCSRYVELFDQEANDFVYETLREGKPCMISKFGTTELNAVVTDLVTSEPLSWSVLKEFFRGELSLSRVQSILQLQKLSGFFPVSPDYGRRFCERVVNDIPEINILGSYIENEKYVLPYMHCKRINLDGYYAPFLWKNPWTKYLEGKKVLVVHPFVDSIKSQYENNRERLFDDPDVLPRFKELILVRAVQSIVGTRTDYVDWFEALKHMEDEISQLDFDIALIGCGAYGMALAAHVKRMVNKPSIWPDGLRCCSVFTEIVGFGTNLPMRNSSTDIGFGLRSRKSLKEPRKLKVDVIGNYDDLG